MIYFTRKERAFIDNLIANPTDTIVSVAIKSGYSPRSASSTASDNLNKPKIKAEIERVRAEMAKQADIPKEKIIVRLDLLAQSAKRDSDKINANTILAKLLGYLKDAPIQSVAIFEDIKRELRRTEAVVATTTPAVVALSTTPCVIQPVITDAVMSNSDNTIQGKQLG